ncbi:MAG TPA: NRDE family protein [Saprospiraceae bacterium]|nr:NRDE family protein [Saprospiraceae bacterium]
MCTVTYLPVPGGFVLTHNRDEAPSRSAGGLMQTLLPQQPPLALLHPRDSLKGGTWVAASGKGELACLLNGAFVKHAHQPPYRLSRGLMLLEFFGWAQPEHFFHDFDLEGIEPFTFIYLRQGRCTEWRWDGSRRHLAHLPPEQPHFWCSAPLYPPDMQLRRKEVFTRWMQGVRTPHLAEEVWNLHHSGSVGDVEYDFVMNRGDRVRTVSITQVALNERGAEMTYEDLLGGNVFQERLSFGAASVNG